MDNIIIKKNWTKINKRNKKEFTKENDLKI